MRSLLPRLLGAIALAASLPACAGPNLWTDGTSVSTGGANGGRLRSGRTLRQRGKGYTIPERWRRRRFNWGTDELVVAIERVGARIRAKDPRATLGVADLSRRGGGKSTWHRSHQTGRDVDLLFFSRDGKNRPFPPPNHDMIAFDELGKPLLDLGQDPYYAPDWETRRFDDRRNWWIIEALLTDGDIRVQYIFVVEHLQKRLLRYAERTKKPRWLIEYARRVMFEPSVAPHDDHFHVRIYCPRTDVFHGCQDTGVIWQHEKKTIKYAGTERYDPILWGALSKASFYFPM